MNIPNANALIWKRRWAAIVAAALSLVVALGFAMPTQASAAQENAGLAAGSAQLTAQEDITLTNPDWMDLWAGDTSYKNLSWFLNGTYRSNLKVTKVASSNSAALKVNQVDKNQQVSSYEICPVKAGKSTLTVTLVQNGTTKVLSETYTVKTFTNGIASITFNGESLEKPTSAAAITSTSRFNFKGTSGTINVKAANGWSLMSIYGHFFNPNSAMSSSLEITNNKAFTIPKGCQASISIGLYNSTSGDSFTYSLNVYREPPLQLAKATYFVGYPKVSTVRYSVLNGEASKIEIVSVKSSKPGVLKATKSNDLFNIKLQAKKAGKSKLTIKYNYEGKTYTTSAQCTVSKQYPLKSVSVNGKKVNLKKNCLSYFPSKYKKGKAKVKVTAAKGWKVKSLQYCNDLISSSAKTKKIKNGASVKTENGKISEVIVTLKKGKQTFTYRLYFDRQS